MVSLVDNGGKDFQDFRGLSSDVKPITKFDGSDVENGASFLELDTGAVYFFDKSTKTWIN